MGRKNCKETRPTFFKVLIGDFSKQLRIPPAFVKNFNGSSLGKCVVKGPTTGRYWAVNVEKIENRLYFGSGWQDFVKCHCLELGDFLVFKYYGNTKFNVKIYDKTCCEKVIKPTQMNNDHPNLHLMKGNQKEIRATTLGCKSVDMKEPINIFQRDGCRRSERKPVTEGVSKPTRSFQSFSSDNACFILNWADFNRYHGTIPVQLAREKKLMINRKVVLTDPAGRSWPVEINVTCDGRPNMRGEMWNGFWKGNELEPGDILIFEFTMSTALQVHIFRGEGRSARTKTMIFSAAVVKMFEPES